MKLILLILIIMLSGCATQNELVNTVNSNGELAGFWMGVWHGLIIEISFIISLFNDNVSIYEIHNNGGWYNFGFVFGVTNKIILYIR